ncbi:MAG: DNA gyrase subunit A [bacterium]|jgi:DNA gyrase subunit A
MEYTHGKILPVDIEKEIKRSYLDYAMSVIVSRALPDVRDGLKPVHRRILYAMSELGNTPDKPYKKSARIVGEVLGRYHPHGDTAVYDAMVRLAQDFSTRYLLVDGHGNFGSVDGDPAAAMRYTEVRLSKLSMEMLADINKETVDFMPNFDETTEEPLVLPSRFPNLLVNGSSGIAVGMATNIPPHNLREVINGIVLMIDNPEVSVRELMVTIKGPDFPTGGAILGRDGIKAAYNSGRGIVKMQATSRIEKMNNGKSRIIVTELPYQVNKAKLIEKIADLVHEKKIEGITDLRDETDRSGMRLVIELRKDANPNVIRNKLHKYTPMQQTFGIILLALVNGRPQTLNLRDMLYHYLEHQKDVVTRRTQFELGKAEARAHILEGLKIALDNLDRVISIIRGSRTVEIAREALIAAFGLSEKQTQAILDMRLQRLTGLEREKIEEEYREIIKTIEYLRAVLANERLLLGIIKDELIAIRDKYGDDRRTRITATAAEIEDEDLIAEEDAVITLTHQGYIKRLPVDTYRSQRRGGRGITGMHIKEEDFVEHLFITTTHHFMLYITNKGRMYHMKVYEIPEASRQAKGTAVVNLVPLAPGESITAVIPVKEFNAEQYLLFVTKNGIVKRTLLSEYDTARKGGLIALGLEENDELITVKLTRGEDEIILATRNGLAIRFPEKDVRSMGRAARGVKGINLGPNDIVVGADTIKDKAELLVVTEKGFGKKTPLDEYRSQNRGGKGIKTLMVTKRVGSIVACKVVERGSEMMFVSAEGVIIRIKASEISSLGRNTQGVTLMRLDENDKLASVALVLNKADVE